MPTAIDVVANKGTKVHSIPPTATALQAIEKMNEHKIGALVVMTGGRVVGMFTERDVLRRVASDERPASLIIVGDVMTADVVCCRPDTDLDDVSATMKDRRIRHLPICDKDGSLHGMISIGDVNAHHASSQAEHISFLSEYIYGRV